MFTILGAGGAIGNELVKELTPRNEAIRLVSRNPTLIPGAAEAIAADLSNRDDTLKVVSGPRIERRLDSRNQFPTSLTGVHDS